MDGKRARRFQAEGPTELRLEDWRSDLAPEIREELDLEIPEHLQEGWRTARANFGDSIHFYAPSLKHYETSGFKNSSRPFFVPVSVTGSSCSLQCDHCRSRILRTMHDASSPGELLEFGRRLKQQGGEGLLISGGSLKDGSVPLLDYLDPIRELKQMGLSIAVHTGLVSKELAQGLADAGVDIAMIDIIGSDETIRDVYHLQAPAAAFEESLRLLTDSGVSTAPHVVIGLDFGQIKGEIAALEMISRYPVASVVLVVLTPEAGTPMGKTAPPSPRAAEQDFRQGASDVPGHAGAARLRQARRRTQAGHRRTRPQSRAERHRLSG